ncbi:MAG: hypothetical protein ACRC9R_05730, partial [Enterovibrio sp.]
IVAAVAGLDTDFVVVDQPTPAENTIQFTLKALAPAASTRAEGDATCYFTYTAPAEAGKAATTTVTCATDGETVTPPSGE